MHNLSALNWKSAKNVQRVGKSEAPSNMQPISLSPQGEVSTCGCFGGKVSLGGEWADEKSIKFK